MPRHLRVYQVDAFTDTPFRGNPAGVVLDAGDLTDAEMQAIARELNNPDTVFVLAADGPDHDFRARFFTPSIEVPMCGHATVAANHVRALLGDASGPKATQKTRTGLIEVELAGAGDQPEVWMTLPVIDAGRPLDGRQRDRLLAALDLRERDLIPRAPLQVVSSGNAALMVPLLERAALHALAPDFDLLRQLAEEIGAPACFPFTLDAEAEFLTHARMFAPAIGIVEDPVTGTAHGPLGIYLVRNGLVPHDGRLLRFLSRQGEAMGRPGTVRVEVAIERGTPVRIRVGGTAVVAFEARLTLPDPPAPKAAPVPPPAPAPTPDPEPPAA
jgi:PhzF family phenazine biosynthesis protein